MATLEVAASTRDERVPEFLFVFCITKHAENLTLPSCPIISVRVRLGHVSIPTSMSDRRILFFADNDLERKLQSVQAPLLVKVNTASYIEVHYY